MTDLLPDTLRRLYTDPGEYIDSYHPLIRDFAGTAAGPATATRPACSIEQSATVSAITPTSTCARLKTFRALNVLAAGVGNCLGKAALYAAVCGVHGLFARVGFEDIKITHYYRANDYFGFFLPAFLLVSLFENVCMILGWEFFCSGIVISARKP